MAEKSTCINHPLVPAVARCKQCMKPVCRNCQVPTDIGIFCSEGCYVQMKGFMARQGAYDKKPRWHWTLSKWIRRLVGLAILLIIIAAVAYFAFGITSIQGGIDWIKSFF
ncbi:MAG: hypothetical protein QME64_07780 [bacterium]|nr:hypothetical protein [bacterium]